MNLEQLRKKLIVAARKHPPSQKVPYAFEKRILSRISERPIPDIWTRWCRPLWQAALSCVAITAICGIWAYGHSPKPDSTDSFSQDFEAAVFAPMGEHVEDAW